MGRRRIACLLLAALLMLCLAPAARAEEENLIFNGGFEQTDSDGLPSGWYPDAYRVQEGYSLFSMRPGEGRNGTGAARIENFSANDARFAQLVEVEPESLYRLSGWVRTEEALEGGRGANLSVAGIYAFSAPMVLDTKGDWQYVECYGETGEDQYELEIYVRLGGYSGESAGAALFDDVSLVRVNEVPGAGTAALWFTLPPSEAEEEWAEDEDETAPAPAWPWLLGGGCAFVLALYLLSQRLIQSPEKERQGTRLWFALGLLLALGLRMWIAASVEGYAVDVNCFTAWGNTFLQTGPAGFYTQVSFCDYPPAYLWVLGLNAWLCRALQASVPLQRVIYRLVPCLCDLASACLIFRLGKRTRMGTQRAALLGLILAFNPAVMLNTAAWGQIDSVLCLLLLAVAVLAMERKWLPLMPVYMLAVLVKPQALMLGPLGLAAILLCRKRHPEDTRGMLMGVGAAAAVAAAVILPFYGSQRPGWLIALYGRTLASYPFATVNTANFYYLLGGNWSPIASQAHIAAPVLFACAALAAGLWLQKHPGGRACARLEPAVLLAAAAAFVLMAVFRASWGVVGAAVMALAFLLLLPMYLRGGKLLNLPLLGAVLFLLLYTLGVKMHERYLFPALFLLAAAYAVRPDQRILALMALTGFTVFLNEGIVLDNSIRLGSSMGHLNLDTHRLNIALSVLNVLTVPLGLWTAWDQALCGRTAEASLLPQGRPMEAAKTEKPALRWNRTDTLLLLSVTLVYSVLTLINLGSTRAPQTAWHSTAEQEQVIFDLGENPEPYRILYYSQVSYSPFSFEFSRDGESWSDRTQAAMSEGMCYRWLYLPGNSGTDEEPQTYTARFVRLNAQQVRLTLDEVVFRTPEGEILPAAIAGRTNANSASPLYSDPAALLDEQDTLQGEPGWYNGTYFDEIYHARTAYEHLHGERPYETTHPPLGKLLMALSIAAFGMTPFGWRFAGALAGILMLPGMYLLVRQLTRKRAPAFAALCLMALDCMHFTQTRIATIDSFPVLFIIFSYFFMLCFLQRDLLNAPLRKLLAPLAASGLCMGLGIASKWIGCYSALGLAALYFAACLRAVRRGGWKRVLLLCAWCLLFFVAVPVLLYTACYIPYFAYRKFTDLRSFLTAVIEAQTGMYNYHSTPGLGMDHPFYSPWHEWVLIARPMYYSSAYRVPEGWSYSIFCFGNPAVWLPGLAAICWAMLKVPAAHIYRVGSGRSALHRKKRADTDAFAFTAVGFLAQFLPWMLVPRGTYIYHYFASVPFLIVAVSLFFHQLMRREKPARWLLTAYLAVCLVFFIGYYPYASGVLTPEWWLEFMGRFLRLYYA